MTDTTIKQVIDNKPNVSVITRVMLGVASSAVTSFLLTWCSLHGYDFKTLGVDSEGIKSTITGSITGVAVAPECIPMAIAAFIIYWRKAGRIISKSVTEELPPDQKE